MAHGSLLICYMNEWTWETPDISRLVQSGYGVVQDSGITEASGQSV